MLSKEIYRKYAAASGDSIAMIRVDNAVVLLTVMPRNITNVAMIAVARCSGSRPTTVLWTCNSLAHSLIFLQFLIPN